MILENWYKAELLERKLFEKAIQLVMKLQTKLSARTQIILSTAHTYKAMRAN